MQKSINLIFQVHQPYHLRKYRFFDIGNDHYYYDDFVNETTMESLARKCYLPACSMLLRRITQHKGLFKVSFFISGITLDLFQKYTPQVLEAFKELAKTGQVEFLGGTWSNSLASLKNRDALNDQIVRQRSIISELFGQEPATFYPAELIYSDDIGAMLFETGYTSAIVDGSKQILGWRSPEMLYSNAVYPAFKLHMQHPAYSDECIEQAGNSGRRKLKWSPQKLVSLMQDDGTGSQEINMCVDYEIFGAEFSEESGIFTFLESFIQGVVNSGNLLFSTPRITAGAYPPASIISVPYPVSREGSGNSITSWMGNELQTEALNKIYGITQQIISCNNTSLTQDWLKLLAHNHFYDMSSQHYASEPNLNTRAPGSPHEAFLNYMHIFSDLKLRLDECCPSFTAEEKIASLEARVEAQTIEISRLKDVMSKTRKQKNNPS
jgi:alpha-amylase